VPDNGLCLLSVHAHPDDEASKGAPTVARYHAEGVRTILVCCTGGEEGDILNPAMDTPEVRADIGKVRMAELKASTDIIGYDETVMLGYRDSGMPDSEANARPDSFAQAPLDEAVGRLVTVIRRERPQVILTYPDEQSEYPHPDHLRVHEISIIAFDAAGDPDRFPEAGPPFVPLKLYYSVWPAERFRQIHARFLELGLESPFDEKRLARLTREDPYTTAIDVQGFQQVQGLALKAHATQVDPNSPFWFGLPSEVLAEIHPMDQFRLAKSRVPGAETVPDGVIEDDLFAGVR
jgi:mycothiol S-conjugate amidase